MSDEEKAKAAKELAKELHEMVGCSATAHGPFIVTYFSGRKTVLRVESTEPWGRAHE